MIDFVLSKITPAIIHKLIFSSVSSERDKNLFSSRTSLLLSNTITPTAISIVSQIISIRPATVKPVHIKTPNSQRNKAAAETIATKYKDGFSFLSITNKTVSKITQADMYLKASSKSKRSR